MFVTLARRLVSAHLRAARQRHISRDSISPGNTKKQRVWFRALFEQADVAHELHFIDRLDDVCKRQLKDRSKHLPTGSPSATVADFDAITAYLKRLRLRSA